MKKYCEGCGKTKKFSIYRENMFTFNSEKVFVCKSCGHLRTVSELRIREGEMRHKHTGKKLKKLRMENFFEDDNND